MYKTIINSISSSSSASSSRLQPRIPTLPSTRRNVHVTTIRSRAPVPTSPIPPPKSSGSASSSAISNGMAGNQPKAKPRSGHMVWYREIVPAMLPVFLLSTTVFLALSLIRTHLSHSKSLSESSERIAELENQLAKVRRDRRIQLAKERKERERILPMVVERVLQRVGAMRQGDEEAIEEEHLKEGERLLV